MIVYYVADKEKPDKADNVKFFTDHSSALASAQESRGSVYQFEVNDKCETNSFGMDTIMIFNKDTETGELKFMGSGRWVELHEIMNMPFYKDFESPSGRIVSMSLSYFNAHYKVVGRKSEGAGFDALNTSVKRPRKKRDINIQAEQLKPKIRQETGSDGGIDADVLDELFGGNGNG